MPNKPKTIRKSRKPDHAKKRNRFSFLFTDAERAAVTKLAVQRDEPESQVVRMFIRMGLREFGMAVSK